MKIVTPQQMRDIEDRSEELGVSKDTLMENAGQSIAKYLLNTTKNLVGTRVVLLVGQGNNGGDGIVAATRLDQLGAKVEVYLCAAVPKYQAMTDLLQQRGVQVSRIQEDCDLSQLREALELAEVVVDAVLGTGLSRAIKDPLSSILFCLQEERKRRPEVRLLAVDTPTGLDPATGLVDPACVAADATLTLGNPKSGLYRFPGAEFTGKVEVMDIGLPSGLDDDIRIDLITPNDARDVLPPRPLGGHKGTFGRTLVVAGSRHYVGAAYLAATAAGRSGAGLVTVATPSSVQMVLASKAVEPTFLPLTESTFGGLAPEAANEVIKVASDYESLLIGCGLGREPATGDFLRRLLLEKVGLPPMVVDADALNFLASTQSWEDHFSELAILTPHLGEMARLTSLSVSEISDNRIEVAQEYAHKWNKLVVLKGAFTVVGFPSGEVRQSPFANPAMATAGTGDVLGGVLSGLLAQEISLNNAATLGVYLHGLAGERVRDKLGDAGMLAGDLLPEIPRAVKSLKHMQTPS
jgi:NAD(P)H-hydrate epimerase